MDKLVYFTMYDHCKLADEFEKNAREVGFTHIHHFDLMHLINSGFYKKHKRKFDELKNAGCVWKPYIIKEVMESSNADDFIYYSDVTDLLKSGLLEFTKKQAEKYLISLIASNFINNEWTKWDCFSLMDCIEDKYLYTHQLDAGQIGIIKSFGTETFIKEWLDYCLQDDILLDHTITEEKFQVNRHSRDQSILTNLAVKYNLPSTPINYFINYYTPNARG